MPEIGTGVAAFIAAAEAAVVHAENQRSMTAVMQFQRIIAVNLDLVMGNRSPFDHFGMRIDSTDAINEAAPLTGRYTALGQNNLPGPKQGRFARLICRDVDCGKQLRGAISIRF